MLHDVKKAPPLFLRELERIFINIFDFIIQRHKFISKTDCVIESKHFLLIHDRQSYKRGKGKREIARLVTRRDTSSSEPKSESLPSTIPRDDWHIRLRSVSLAVRRSVSNTLPNSYISVQDVVTHIWHVSQNISCGICTHDVHAIARWRIRI